MGLRESAARNAGKLLNTCAKNNGMFLFTTAAIGYVLASLAQTVGLILNKKIDKEEKKFLVPQEIFDGVSNIVTYAAITFPIMAGAKSLAAKKLPDNPKAIEGANTLAAVAGGIIASNIATPILRNKTGAKVQRIIENKVQKSSSAANPFGRNESQTSNVKRITLDNYIKMTKPVSYSGSMKI